MDTVEGRVCLVENPEAFSEPTRLRFVAHWLLEFGMDVGTIPDIREKEEFYFGEEDA